MTSATTTIIHTVGPKGARGRYGAVIPTGASVLSVKRDGVNVPYVVSVQARKTRVSEPPEGGGWSDGKIKIEVSTGTQRSAHSGSHQEAPG